MASSLTDPVFFSRLENLELRARGIVEGFMQGLHRSPFVGFSVEFASHREYVQGDDLRHVNWKLYACLLYTSPSPRDGLLSRMPSSA